MYNNNLLAQSLISPQYLSQQVQNAMQTLGLNQIQGFDPIKEFNDDSGTKWQLVKSALDSSIDIPNPKTIQIVDYWNHAYPNLQNKLYIYVVIGIKQPRVETERPMKVMYQWFSTIGLTTWTPQMITEREWLKANVYAANMSDSRESILNALCKVKPVEQKQDDEPLLDIQELNSNNKDI